jgi:L-ribulose-5-phosphate 3-epimerase
MVEHFKLAIDCGFEQIECPTTEDQSKEINHAAEASGLRIHSVMNMAHWKYPLSSPDRSMVAASIKGMETSLCNAHFWGADTALFVPAVADAKTGYREASKRSQDEIRRLIPLVKELNVVIAVEEVSIGLKYTRPWQKLAIGVRPRLSCRAATRII